MTTETQNTPAAVDEQKPAVDAPPAVQPHIGEPPEATPVVKVDGEQAPAPAEGEAPVIKFDPTGQPGLDLALGFIAQRGFGPDHPAVKAAEAGDFALLKAELALLGDKANGYEQVLAVAERDLGILKKEAEARYAAEAKAIHEAVGGEDVWNSVSTWAGSAAAPEEKAQVNAALALGGVAAKAMATYLLGQYQRASGTVVEPKEAAPGSTTGNAASAYALSPKAYLAEVQALRVKLKGAMDSSPEYAQLKARRLAWKP